MNASWPKIHIFLIIKWFGTFMLNLGIQLCNCYASIHFSFVCESTWPFVELFTISIPICDQIHGQTCLGLWAMKLAGIFKANMAILDLIFWKYGQNSQVLLPIKSAGMRRGHRGWTKFYANVYSWAWLSLWVAGTKWNF